jgi:hypothetical protein
MGRQVHVCGTVGDAGNGAVGQSRGWIAQRSRDRLGRACPRPCREEMPGNLPSRRRSHWRWCVNRRSAFSRLDSTRLNGFLSSVPNTTIRSRVLGKPLIPRFPSPLPPDTVLDCILDQNWKENGILHVLDVIKWKGQDIADCESSFRSMARFIPGRDRTSY